jgi:ribosomal protein S18 acetylase RimI-like enzyme
MNYRKAENRDLDKVTKLFDQYRLFYGKKTDLKGAKKFLTERVSKNDSVIYIAENPENKIIGFVQLYPLFSSTRMRKFWLLNDLFVDPDHRSEGIAIELINKAKELVKSTDACGMYLETEKSNVIGNKLYPKTGFKLNTDCNFYEWDSN